MRKTTLMLMAGSLLALPVWAAAQGYESETGQPQTEQRMGQMGQSAEVFKDERNFRVEGKVASVDPSSGQLMLQREGLPPAALQIANDTEIKVDGETGTLSQLQPGDEVRADFNLAENQPIAISVEAKESKENRQMRERQEGAQPRR